MAPHPIIEYTSEASWAMIEDKFSPFAKETLAKLITFLEEEVFPATKLAHEQLPTDPVLRWKTVIPVIAELKEKAKKLGLWNLFLSKAHYPEHGVPLTNLEYAVMAELLGRGGHVASEVVNCAAPDTGNMEVLARYGSPAQQKKWLIPLLNGEIRSAFAMTEKNVASSDAKNIQTSIRREGNEIVVNGHKWWISGAGDPRTKLHLVMGKSDPGNKSAYHQQSVVIVPADAPGVKVIRPMHVFGYDDAPEGHCEIIYENVRVPLDNLVLGWGRGFEIIQGRLGPGRIHHCMRSIGVAQAALDLMLQRVTDPGRKTFGKYLYEHGSVVQDIAKSRAEIESARLLVLSAALQAYFFISSALKEIGIAKFVVPSMALTVIDRAIQSFGAEGVSQDTELAQRWAGLRTLRIADVHIQQVGQRELRRAPRLTQKAAERKKKQNALLEKAGIKAHLIYNSLNFTKLSDALMFLLLPRRASSLSLSCRRASSHATKNSPRRRPQRTLPDDKLRALISLYHQADTFITKENLSDRIDAAFLSSSKWQHYVTVDDLQGQLKQRRQSARIVDWQAGMVSEGASGHSWSSALKGRELRVRQALFGLSGDQGNLPGLEAVKELEKDKNALAELQDDFQKVLKQAEEEAKENDNKFQK
ncbi:hypothetical protein H0H92_001592 [Tricholoma furcatifolium]|nr:hypothetical protein H0H92_001592 [Tricholoma furcatifolium]